MPILGLKCVTIYYPGNGVAKDSNSATYKNATILDANESGIKFRTDADGEVIFNGPYRIKDKMRAEKGEEAPAAAAARPRRNW